MSNELEALTIIDKTLNEITDDESRGRILRYINDKYFPKKGAIDTFSKNLGPQDPAEEPQPKNEIPGIAVLDENNNITFTIRDLKAKSANDAGLRCALLSILIHEKLTGEKKMSSKKYLAPLLRDTRIYDSNVLRVIRDHKGIIREGDLLKLDSHAKTEAEDILEQILNPEAKGKWQPSVKKMKRAKSDTKEQA